MLADFRHLMDRYRKLPSYDGEWGHWYMEDLDDHQEGPNEIVTQILDSVNQGNRKVIDWNEKAKLLRELGLDHIFVQGYLSREPGWWRMLSKGDGICCLYGKGCQPRTAKGYLDFISPRLRKIWPDMPELESVAYHLGYYAAAHFRYAGRLPDFGGVDIHDERPLQEILLCAK
jgi:hypothetical protein